MTNRAFDTAYKYWSFISYSHADQRWGRWLHHALETYRIPRSLVGRDHEDGSVPRRLHPVFRDRDELSGSHSLEEGIRKALEASGYLIVICSPRSAKSQYVDQEIRLFKSLGRERRVLSLIVDGEPHAQARGLSPELECFPPALLHGVGPEGELTDQQVEPIAADVRPGKDDRHAALLKIVAGILGVGFDDLRQRDLRRQRTRRRNLLLGVAASMLLVFLAYVGLSDAGVNLPGSEPTRTALDRYSLTAFRPVYSDQQVRQEAARLRTRLLDTITSNQDEGGLFLNGLGRANSGETDTWTTTQWLAGISRAPDTKAECGEDLLRAMQAVIDDPQATYRDGRLIGWKYRAHNPPEAEMALWLATAVFQARERDDVFDPSQQARLQTIVQTIEPALFEHRSSDGRRWHSFTGLVNEADHHDIYATTLALQALLAARRAGAEIDSSLAGDSVDAMIAALCSYLVENYEEGAVRGWQRFRGNFRTPVDGLSLQIYATLLEAEAETDFELPPAIFAGATAHLVACGDRDVDYPMETIEVVARIAGEDGRATAVNEAVNYDWYPWAIKGCSLWLRREQGPPPRADQTRRVRRTLGRLVVDLGDQAVEERVNTYGWQAAELLYCLSQVADDPRSGG